METSKNGFKSIQIYRKKGNREWRAICQDRTRWKRDKKSKFPWVHVKCKQPCDNVGKEWNYDKAITTVKGKSIITHPPHPHMYKLLAHRADILSHINRATNKANLYFKLRPNFVRITTYGESCEKKPLLVSNSYARGAGNMSKIRPKLMYFPLVFSWYRSLAGCICAIVVHAFRCISRDSVIG